MEDRMKNIINKKKLVKNNFKNIEVLPTLENTEPIEEPFVTKEGEDNGENKDENEEMANEYADMGNDFTDIFSSETTETNETTQQKSGNMAATFKDTLVAVQPATITSMTTSFVVTLLYWFYYKSIVDEKILIRICIGIFVTLFIFLFISLLFGKQCGFGPLTWDSYKTLSGWKNIIGAMLYSPYCVMRTVASLFVLAVGTASGDKGFLQQDTDWVTQSIFELVSIILAYGFTCVLYFASNGPCARPGEGFSDDYVPFIIKYLLLSFSYIGPQLVYLIFGKFLPYVIEFFELKKINKFFFLFILAWIMVHFFLPLMASSLMDIFKWRANPYIYALLLIGFVFYVITPDINEIRKWMNFDWKYLVVLLINLIFVLIFAPVSQVFFVLYTVYYFASCKVDVDTLNDDLTPEPGNRFHKYANTKPDDLAFQNTDSAVPNFLWIAYIIFFLWKIAELTLGYFKVDKFAGVQSSFLFYTCIGLSVIALIIMVAIAFLQGQIGKLATLSVRDTRPGVSTEPVTIDAVKEANKANYQSLFPPKTDGNNNNAATNADSGAYGSFFSKMTDLKNQAQSAVENVMGDAKKNVDSAKSNFNASVDNFKNNQSSYFSLFEKFTKPNPDLDVNDFRSMFKIYASLGSAQRSIVNNAIKKYFSIGRNSVDINDFSGDIFNFLDTIVKK